LRGTCTRSSAASSLVTGTRGSSFCRTATTQTIVLYELPQFPGPGEYRGWAGLRDWFEQGSEVFETFELVPQEFIEHGDEVVVPLIAYGRSRAGVDTELLLVHRLTVKDDKVVVLRVFPTEADALDAEGPSE
jgi:ketosteroid isomerase-like protein